MLLTLICLLVLLLVLVALLARQTNMTRRAVEETEMWKRLYKSSYLKHEAAARKSEQVSKKNTPAARRQPLKPATRHRTKIRERRSETAKTALIPAEIDTIPERLTLVLPIQLLSKNARDKLHYQAKNRLRKDYQDVVQIKYPRRGEPTPQVRQRATVTRILGPRERRFDQQNVGAGSAIELIDASTRAGFWVNDSEKWLETRFEQAPSGKLRGPAVTVEITVTDVS